MLILPPVKYPSILLIGLLAADPLFSQASKQKSPDEEWKDFATSLSIGTPAVVAVPGTITDKKSINDIKAEQVTKTVKARQAAQVAKDFYTKYPTHEKAAEAKKQEAILSLKGVLDNDKAQEAAAQQLAASYRTNTTNSTADRFEVAVLAENVKARTTLKARATNKTKERETIADRLRTEFGDIRQVFDYYLSIARSADSANAAVIANKILQWPASAEAKLEAQSIVARHGLLNNRLGFHFTGLDGNVIDPGQTGGRKTLVFLWSPTAGENRFDILSKLSKSQLLDLRILYVAVGAPPQAASADSFKLPVPGIICYDASGANTILAGLTARTLPYVFVLDAGGRVTSYGPAAELANLMGGTAR